MAGIYIHIPFCKSRCIYCGFYSTTRPDLQQSFVDALCREWKLRQDYIDLSRVRTIYIGGGTPSLLTSAQLHQLFEALHDVVPLCDEITMECNPDDVTMEFAEMLSHLPVNRVSMGAQAFCDSRLRFLRRRHLSAQIPVAVDRLRCVGIGNISIDLMFGFPNETMEEWTNDIDAALALRVEHLSAYSLMYEEGTPLCRMLENGEVAEVDEELSRRMYYELVDRLTEAGFEHYEISNFARPGFRSRHNSSYWDQTPYLGLGASAHSFDGRSRGWNVDDVESYIGTIQQGHLPLEREELNDDTRYNEMVMTALRTCEGINLVDLSNQQRHYCLSQADKYLADGLLVKEKGRLRLTRSGLFVSDMVMSDLMLV